MSLYRRGRTWWFEFEFDGARIRESARTTSKTIAKQAEQQRRRELELGINGLTKRERPPLFPAAAKDWRHRKRRLLPSVTRITRSISGNSRVISEIGLCAT